MCLSVSGIAKYSILMYTITISFSHAYAIYKYLPLPMIILLISAISIIIILFSLQSIKYYDKLFGLYDLWIILFLFWVALSLLVALQTEQKNINHLIALFAVVGMYYFFIKLLLSISYALPHSPAYHNKFLIYPFFLTSIFICLEFIDANFIDLNLRSVVVYAEDIKEYSPLYARMFYRARGFTSESGNLALFLNIFSPLVVAYFLVRKQYAYLVFSLILYTVALLLSFSAAGIFFIFMGAAVSVVVYLWDHKIIDVSLKAVIFVSLISLLWITIFTVIPDEYMLPIKYKITFSESSSVKNRLERWADAVESFKQYPLFGTGIGSTSAKRSTGVISFYLLLLKEAGLIAFTLFICFVLSMFCKVLTMPKTFNYKYGYTVSFVAGVGHYIVISDFWLPWIWFLFAIISCDYALLKRDATV